MTTSPGERSSGWDQKLKDLNLAIRRKQFRRSLVKDGDEIVDKCFDLAETLRIEGSMNDINRELMEGEGWTGSDFSREKFDWADEQGNKLTSHFAHFGLTWNEVQKSHDEIWPAGSISVDVEIVETEEDSLRVGRIFVGDELMPTPALSHIQDALLQELRRQLEL